MFYLVQYSDSKILCENPSKSIPLDNSSFISEGDDNLSFPVLVERTNELGSVYPWIEENVVKLETYNSLLSEQEILKFEIQSEDYEHGNLLPKLKKLARLKQLELILASGNF